MYCDPDAARAASASGRTFDGPQPKRPSVGFQGFGKYQGGRIGHDGRLSSLRADDGCAATRFDPRAASTVCHWGRAQSLRGAWRAQYDLGREAMPDYNQMIIEEFRANGGEVGGNFAGAPLLLLHTVGAKSGLERVNPMMYLADDGRYLVFASKAGAPTNPGWYHNLLANPRAIIEVGHQTLQVDAVDLQGEERTRMYDKQAELYSGFATYQENTDRVIPVVALIPRPPSPRFSSHTSAAVARIQNSPAHTVRTRIRGSPRKMGRTVCAGPKCMRGTLSRRVPVRRSRRPVPGCAGRVRCTEQPGEPACRAASAPGCGRSSPRCGRR